MIGQEVRRYREGLGLTGAELAARSGLSPGAISQIENGKRTPSSTTVMKLAQGLGIEVGELYPKDPSPRLPLEERGASAQPRARSAAEGRLTIPRTLEDLMASLTEEQVREILLGVVDGRIKIDEAAAQAQEVAQGSEEERRTVELRGTLASGGTMTGELTVGAVLLGFKRGEISLEEAESKLEEIYAA